MTKAVKFNRFCALIVLLAFCVLFVKKIPGIYAEKFDQMKSDIQSHYATPLKDDLLKRLFWNYMNMTNRKNINGVTILNDGRLMIDVIDVQPFLIERTNAIISLNNYLQENGVPFLFIRGHSKLRDSAELPLGYDNNTIEYGDRFLARLRQNDVDTLDLREEMLNENLDFAKAFFRGDTHWTAETAFWAFGKTGDLMNKTYGFQVDADKWNMQG